MSSHWDTNGSRLSQARSESQSSYVHLDKSAQLQEDLSHQSHFMHSYNYHEPTVETVSSSTASATRTLSVSNQPTNLNINQWSRVRTSSSGHSNSHKLYGSLSKNELSSDRSSQVTSRSPSVSQRLKAFKRRRSCGKSTSISSTVGPDSHKESTYNESLAHSSIIRTNSSEISHTSNNFRMATGSPRTRGASPRLVTASIKFSMVSSEPHENSSIGDMKVGITISRKAPSDNSEPVPSRRVHKHCHSASLRQSSMDTEPFSLTIDPQQSLETMTSCDYPHLITLVEKQGPHEKHQESHQEYAAPIPRRERRVSHASSFRRSARISLCSSSRGRTPDVSTGRGKYLTVSATQAASSKAAARGVPGSGPLVLRRDHVMSTWPFRLTSWNGSHATPNTAQGFDVMSDWTNHKYVGGFNSILTKSSYLTGSGDDGKSHHSTGRRHRPLRQEVSAFGRE